MESIAGQDLVPILQSVVPSVSARPVPGGFRVTATGRLK